MIIIKAIQVKLNNEMYNDFCKCCEQEHYSYEVLSKTTDYVVCNADYRIIEFFIRCMKSEHEETIKILCSLPKEMLLNRINITQDKSSDYWINRINVKLINEALQRYDEPFMIRERTKILNALC